MTQMIAIPAKTMTTESEFFIFHRDHPEVYDSLVSLARMTRAAGVEKYGIRDLLAVCRWQAKLRNKKFGVRNAFTPYYARLIQAQETDLTDFFFTAVAACDEDMVLTEALAVPTAPFMNTFEVAASIFLGKPLRQASRSLFALK